jgi:hypothetical protein
MSYVDDDTAIEVDYTETGNAQGASATIEIDTSDQSAPSDSDPNQVKTPMTASIPPAEAGKVVIPLSSLGALFEPAGEFLLATVKNAVGFSVGKAYDAVGYPWIKSAAYVSGTASIEVSYLADGVLPVSQPTVALYWASGTTWNSRITTDAVGNPLGIASQSLTEGLGTQTATFPVAALGPRPTGATQVIAVVDPPQDLVSVPLPATVVPVVPAISQPTVTIDAGHVVPTEAKDLNLYQFFASESLDVPIVFTNNSPSQAKGQLKLELYLSRTPDLSGKVFKLDTWTQTIVVAPLASRTYVEKVQIPTAGVSNPLLRVGSHYYLVPKVVSSGIPGLTSKNDTGTAPNGRAFEYLGASVLDPDAFRWYDKLKVNGKSLHIIPYFWMIKNVLSSSQPTLPLKSAADFIKKQEGPYTFPYLDGEGIPTVGYGINLKQLKPEYKFAQQLIADVKADWHNRDIDEHTFEFVKGLLTDIAKDIGLAPSIGTSDYKHYTAVDSVVTADQSSALLGLAIQEKYLPSAATPFGKGWDQLKAWERVALIDLAFNPPRLGRDGVVTPLISDPQDFVLAGFNLVDLHRTTAEPGLVRRVGDEYYDLLVSHVQQLGRIVNPAAPN